MSEHIVSPDGQTGVVETKRTLSKKIPDGVVETPDQKPAAAVEVVPDHAALRHESSLSVTLQ